jgi:hypothetical protein
MSDQLPAIARGSAKGSRRARTGLYVKGANGRRLRDQRVRRLVQKMRDAMPWLDDAAFLPACRAWAEFEILSSIVFAELRRGGVVNKGGEARRLLNDYRLLRQTQLGYERELGMTPAAKDALHQPGGRTERDVTDTVAERVVEIGKGRAQTGGEAVDDGIRGRE